MTSPLSSSRTAQGSGKARTPPGSCPGSGPRTAQAIARKLGIDDVRAGLKHEDKVAPIRELEREHGAVAMIGDGVNDAPALAAATVGMAMGTAGCDTAIEAAGVALMADDRCINLDQSCAACLD